jgi:hypothetical protein
MYYVRGDWKKNPNKPINSNLARKKNLQLFFNYFQFLKTKFPNQSFQKNHNLFI